MLKYLLFSLWGIFVLTHLVNAIPITEHYYYQDIIGDQSFNHKITIKNKLDQKVIEIIREEEVVIIKGSPDHLTGQLMLVDRKNEKTDFQVKREANQLYISGLLKGKKIQEVKKIDDSPWINAPGVVLRDFFKQGGAKIEFWIISTPGAQLIKMEIYKLYEEDISLRDKTYHCNVFRMAPAGWKAFFWKAKLWVDQETGITLRYQGPLDEQKSQGYHEMKMVFEGYED